MKSESFILVNDNIRNKAIQRVLGFMVISPFLLIFIARWVVVSIVYLREDLK